MAATAAQARPVYDLRLAGARLAVALCHTLGAGTRAGHSAPSRERAGAVARGRAGPSPPQRKSNCRKSNCPKATVVNSARVQDLVKDAHRRAARGQVWCECCPSKSGQWRTTFDLVLCHTCWMDAYLLHLRMTDALIPDPIRRILDRGKP